MAVLGCSWTKTLTVAVLLLGAGRLGFAQLAPGASTQSEPARLPSVQSGSLAGKLTDLHSKPLEGVVLVARNQATGAEARTVTTKNGAYRFSSLAPGEYTLEAESPRLGRGQVEEIVVAAGYESRVQAAMEFEPLPPGPVLAQSGGANQPALKQLNLSQPGLNKPDMSRSDLCQPDLSRPGLKRPELNRPNLGQLNLSRDGLQPEALPVNGARPAAEPLRTPVLSGFRVERHAESRAVADSSPDWTKWTGFCAADGRGCAGHGFNFRDCSISSSDSGFNCSGCRCCPCPLRREWGRKAGNWTGGQWENP
jgi:hypothetical protein